MATIPDDPETTAYQAVRAHELMLNEAVSRFEHARLAPLIVLNGGAVVAFLTLLGALLGKDSGRHPELWLSGLATGAWVGGLLAAALAVAAATKQQQAISAAHRLLREGLDDVLLGDKRRSQDKPVAELLRGPVPELGPPQPRTPTAADGTAADATPPSTLKKLIDRSKRWWTGVGVAESEKSWADDESEREEERTTARKKLRRTAAQHGQRFKARWALSVAMFVIGATLALAAIVLGDPVLNPSDRRELRAVLDESAQHLAALTAPPKPQEIRQLERDNLRLLLRLGSDSRVSQAHDDAVEAAKTWVAADARGFRRQSDRFIREADRLARSKFRAP